MKTRKTIAKVCLFSKSIKIFDNNKFTLLFFISRNKSIGSRYPSSVQSIETETMRLACGKWATRNTLEMNSLKWYFGILKSKVLALCLH